MQGMIRKLDHIELCTYFIIFDLTMKILSVFNQNLAKYIPLKNFRLYSNVCTSGRWV